MPLKKIINKYNNMQIEAKASIWYTLCNILQKGIAFIVVPLYIRILSTAEYGRYTTFLTWKEILIIFASLNLYCGVFTKAMVDIDKEKDRDRYTSSMQGITTLIAASMFVVYISLKGVWNHLLDSNTTDMCLLFVYFIMFPSFSFWSVNQYGYYHFVGISINTYNKSNNFLYNFFTRTCFDSRAINYSDCSWFILLYFTVY